MSRPPFRGIWQNPGQNLWTPPLGGGDRRSGRDAATTSGGGGEGTPECTVVEYGGSAAPPSANEGGAVAKDGGGRGGGGNTADEIRDDDEICGDGPRRRPLPAGTNTPVRKRPRASADGGRSEGVRWAERTRGSGGCGSSPSVEGGAVDERRGAKPPGSGGGSHFTIRPLALATNVVAVGGGANRHAPDDALTCAAAAALEGPSPLSQFFAPMTAAARPLPPVLVSSAALLPAENKKQAPPEQFRVPNKTAKKIQCGRRATRRVQNAKAAESNNMTPPRGQSKVERQAVKGREIHKDQPKSESAGGKRGDPAPPVKIKKARTNWSKSSIMEDAVLQWDAKRPINQISGKPYSMNAFAKSKGIPPQTFYDYARPDKLKRHTVGAQQGKPSLISKHTSEFLCQIAQRADRANEGLTPSQLQDKMQRLNPEISREQAKNHYHRTFKKAHIGKLKPRAVKAQGTSSRRSQCTVAQEFRWRTTVDKALDVLRAKNTR